MTKITPFRALTYNQEKNRDISRVACPPYDVISAEKQQHYHELNPYNFIHILLSKDTPGEDKYVKAGKYFREWQKNQVLIQDKTPAIYFYSQQYNLKGEKRTRFGFMALLRLGDRNSGIFGHEHTHSLAKEDRSRLLRQVKANLSPIFVIFPDKKRIIQRIKEKYIHNKLPFIDIMNDEKIIHKIWRLDSPDVLADIQDKMSGENIFIADGHHRYEVACAYKDEMRKSLGATTGDESFNYILAYFTNTESRSLTILPVHRLVRLDLREDMPGLKMRLLDYFDVEEIKDKTKFFFLLSKAGASEHILGMYKDKKYWFLRLKNIRILDEIISDKPREYRLLDVSILNYIVLKRILGLELEDKEIITFSPSADELIERVDADPAYVAFFLNPVKIQQLMEIALSGEKMPPKSTYFYPKVLSGLLINKF